MPNAGDVAATVVAVAGAAAQLAWDRRRGRAIAGGVPLRAEDVTAAWVGEAIGAPVREIRPLGGHSGTTTRARIAVEVAPSAHPGRSFPETLFLKLAPDRFVTAIFGSVFELGANEVRFYQQLANEVPVEVPRVYCARAASGGDRFVLLLEDLAARDCAFRGIEESCDEAEAHAVVEALARLHARYWESPRLDDDLAWLPRRGREPAVRAARVLCEVATRPALRICGDVLSPRMRGAGALINARRDEIEDAWARPPRTLLHGDPHLGNLYFPPPEGPTRRVGFLDWQIVRCGQAMRDVAHFVVSSLPVEVRRAQEEALLAHYVETLGREGVAWSLDAAREHYRLQTVYEWFGATVTAAAETLQTAGVARAALERAGAAIEDWDALDAVAAL